VGDLLLASSFPPLGLSVLDLRLRLGLSSSELLSLEPPRADRPRASSILFTGDAERLREDFLAVFLRRAYDDDELDESESEELSESESLSLLLEYESELRARVSALALQSQCGTYEE
jgi:hypothetical protein